MKYRCVVWDWNGTLLNDVEYCLRLTNHLLTQRHLTPLEGLSEYRERFSFPVKAYYASLGIGEEDFVEAAHIWMDAYMADEASCPLQPGAEQIIREVGESGMPQIILSASKQSHLEQQLRSRPGITCPCYGIRDIYAAEKQSLAREVLPGLHWEPGDTVFVGDTLHDAEVAAALGCGCVLVANGHQSLRRLKTAGVLVCEDLGAVKELLLRP